MYSGVATFEVTMLAMSLTMAPVVAEGGGGGCVRRCRRKGEEGAAHPTSRFTPLWWRSEEIEEGPLQIHVLRY